MGYIDDNLTPGETLVVKAEVSYFVFLPGALLFFFGLFVSGSGMGFEFVFFALAFFLFLRGLVDKGCTELAITSKRVVAKVGFISRTTAELNHSKVESFHIRQSILGRLFNYGTVIINGTGGGETPIPNITSPLAFRKKAMEVIDKVQA